MDVLIGTWTGEGRGRYPTIADFAYREEVEFFRPPGKALLAYRQRTWHADDGRPLHGESGYLRFPADQPGVVEAVIAHGTGHVELSAGTLDDDGVLRLGSTLMAPSPTAKQVEGIDRVYEVDAAAGTLRYTLAMAAVGLPMTAHLEGELRRSDG